MPMGDYKVIKDKQGVSAVQLVRENGVWHVTTLHEARALIEKVLPDDGWHRTVLSPLLDWIMR